MAKLKVHFCIIFYIICISVINQKIALLDITNTISKSIDNSIS